MRTLNIFAGRHAAPNARRLTTVHSNTMQGAMSEARSHAGSLIRAYNLDGVAVRDVLGGLRLDVYVDGEGKIIWKET